MVAHLKMDLFETEILCWKASFSGFMLVFLRCPWMCFLMFFDNFQFPKSYRIPQLVVEFWNPLQNSLLPSLAKIMIRVFSVCPTKWFFVGLGKNECCFLIGKKYVFQMHYPASSSTFQWVNIATSRCSNSPPSKKVRLEIMEKNCLLCFFFGFPCFFFGRMFIPRNSNVTCPSPLGPMEWIYSPIENPSNNQTFGW